MNKKFLKLLPIAEISNSNPWGIYYYEPYPARKRVYQRYGLNLRFTERFYMGINIKSNGHVADLMDVRLGIQF